MLNKGAFALEIVRGDPELTADCRVTLNRGDRIGSLDCSVNCLDLLMLVNLGTIWHMMRMPAFCNLMQRQ